MGGDGVVIAGGGLAAQRCAETLRRRGYEGPLRIVCGEDEPPYDRPPLSKGVLAGDPVAALPFRPPAWYEQNGVELLLGTAASGLEPDARALLLADGRRLRYGSLLIATGGSARTLPFLAGFENVHGLRTVADAARLRASLLAGGRLAIVGAGFIGQEVAATARSLGVEVTLIEALPTPLEPILGAELGRWFAALHDEEGVEVLTGAGLAAAYGEGRIEELELAGGRRVACDHVLVGVGTLPATEWLRGSGLDPAGPRVDAAGRTGLPGVFAAGDASVPFDPRHGGHARTEHWDAAAWQGAAAARAMLGEEPGTPPLPSFWSDQYGVRVQYVGHARHADRVVLEGDPAGRDFEALFLRGAVPVAGLTVGRPRAIPALRKRIERAHPAALGEEAA